MSPPPFEVRYDRFRRRLYWTMRGLWTMGDVAGFVGALRAAVAPLGAPPHDYDGLCDSRDFKVQPRDVSAALGQIDDASRSMRKGRTAVVVGSMMNKLQAERTLKSFGTRVFLTMDEAETWLNDGSKQP